jgi:AcrR family transcriptional regulator
MSAAAKSPIHNEEATGGTRQRLLLTGLHLYAQEGLHAVSLRRISAAAGSKNSAAMHYHFSNKLGVIEALVEMIAMGVNQSAKNIRQRSAGQQSLRDNFRDTLRPLAQLPLEQPWGADAIRFMSRLITENDPKISAAINSVYEPFWHRVDRDLQPLVPELPDEIRQLRLMFMSVNVFHGLAEVASLAHTPLGDLSHFSDEALLDHLVDYLIGGLVAPAHNN